MLHVLHVPHDVAPVHPLQRLHYAASREAAGRAAEGASGSGGLILLTDQRWFLSSAQQQQFWASSTSPDAILRRLVEVLGNMHGMDGVCPHWRAQMRLYEHTACIGAVQDTGGGSDACRRVQRGVDPPTGNEVKREAAHQDRNTRISRCVARQRSARALRAERPRRARSCSPSSSLLFLFLPCCNT